MTEWLARRGGSRPLSARLVDRAFEEQVAVRVNEEILAAKGTALNIHVTLQDEQLVIKTGERKA